MEDLYPFTDAEADCLAWQVVDAMDLEDVLKAMQEQIVMEYYKDPEIYFEDLEYYGGKDV